MKTRKILHVLGMIGLLLLASCASKKLYGPNRESLAAAHEKVVAGDREQAAQQMEKLLMGTAAEESTYVLQRFFAAYLLARAHAEAAFVNPFLSGPERESSGFSVGSSAEGQGSTVANLIASTYFAGYGRGWYRDASGANPVVGGENLLPPALEALGTRNAMVHLNLVLLTAYSRLQFQERIIRILDDVPELRELETCDQLMSDSQVGDAMRPWIYRGIFDYMSRTDEVAAYKFAIRVLDMQRAGTSTEPALVEGLSQWVTEDSKYDFKCGTCKTDVNPDLPACAICGKPNLEFEPEEKEQTSGNG